MDCLLWIGLQYPGYTGPSWYRDFGGMGVCQWVAWQEDSAIFIFDETSILIFMVPEVIYITSTSDVELSNGFAAFLIKFQLFYYKSSSWLMSNFIAVTYTL